MSQCIVVKDNRVVFIFDATEGHAAMLGALRMYDNYSQLFEHYKINPTSFRAAVSSLPPKFEDSQFYGP